MKHYVKALWLVTLLLIDPPTVGAAEEGYPQKPIELVIGFPAGGTSDPVARYFANKVQQLSKATILVINKPGALANIASTAVARAKPDGYTLLIAPSSALAGNLYLIKEKAFDPLKDLIPIASLFDSTFTFVVHNDSPINSMQELTAYVREKGEAATFGYGTILQLAGVELYQKIVGVKARGVPYRGSTDVWNALYKREVDFSFSDVGPVILSPPKAKALAAGTAERFPVMPNVPGAREAGIPGFDLSTFWAIYAPAGTPPDVVAKIRSWFDTTVDSEETKKFLKEVLGTIPLVRASSDVMRKRLEKDIEQWRELTTLAKVEAQ